MDDESDCTFQVALALQTMGAVSQKTGTKSLVISGDFNTPPDYPAYAFIKDGYMSDLTRKSAEHKTDTKGILTPVSTIIFMIYCQTTICPLNLISCKYSHFFVVIEREAREIILLVASVCPSVRLSVCLCTL